MNEICFVYITAPNVHQARTIGKELVESRLAACVNIIENMNSFYWWKNEIQDDREAVLIAKTVKKHVPQLTEKVKSLHSYECPCIAALPVIDGNIEFFNWIKEETDLKKKSKE